MQASAGIEQPTPSPSHYGPERRTSPSKLSRPAAEQSALHRRQSSGESCKSMPTIPIVLGGAYEDSLCIEMLMLFQELLPTRDSYQRRRGLVEKIERLLNKEWRHRDIKVHLFGSSVNDLGTHQSDVDLCITTPWGGLRNVRVLAKLFRKCGMEQVVCVPHAKVPIVRLFDPESQLACDINVNNTLALQNTEMIRKYVSIDPRVRPLIMVIKHWTKQRMLSDAANGGTLSTYTWTCMVINFLQMRQPPILPVLHAFQSEERGMGTDHEFCSIAEELRGFGKANLESLGGLLFAFFRRFAVELDYDTQVISVRHGRYLTKQEKGWDTGWNRVCLCVEEPFNVSRNLGNSADVTSVKGLQVEFTRALDMLVANDSLSALCRPYTSLASSTTPRPNSTKEAPPHHMAFLAPFRPHSPADNPPIPSVPPSPRLPSFKGNQVPTQTEPPKHKHSRSRPFHPGSRMPRPFASPCASDDKTQIIWHKENPLPVYPDAIVNSRNPPENERSMDTIFARYRRSSGQDDPPLFSERRKSKVYATLVQPDSGRKEHRDPHRRLSLYQDTGISVGRGMPGEWAVTASQPSSPVVSWHPQNTPHRRRRWSTMKKTEQSQQAGARTSQQGTQDTHDTFSTKIMDDLGRLERRSSVPIHRPPLSPLDPHTHFGRGKNKLAKQAA